MQENIESWINVAGSILGETGALTPFIAAETTARRIESHDSFFVWRNERYGRACRCD